MGCLKKITKHFLGKKSYLDRFPCNSAWNQSAFKKEFLLFFNLSLSLLFDSPDDKPDPELVQGDHGVPGSYQHEQKKRKIYLVQEGDDESEMVLGKEIDKDTFKDIHMFGQRYIFGHFECCSWKIKYLAFIKRLSVVIELFYAKYVKQ